MKVIGIGRASTADQHITRELQENKIREYCKLYDLELVAFFYDAAVSGADPQKRIELNRALLELTAGNADGIIVYKLDRLTRSLSHLNELLESYFKKYALLSVSEQLDTNSPSGRLVINILMSVSQWEREIISERTKEALATKKAKGEPVGRVSRITDETKQLAYDLWFTGKSYADIGKQVGLSASTVGTILKAERLKRSKV